MDRVSAAAEKLRAAARGGARSACSRCRVWPPAAVFSASASCSRRPSATVADTRSVLYAIVFGLLVLVVEIKDKARIVSVAYDWVDTYLKFLTLQRGKGAFFMGVGILVFFIWPEGDKGRLVWGINNVSALMLSIVGCVHASRIIKEERKLGPGMEAVDPNMDFSKPIGSKTSSSSRTQWNDDEL